MSQIARGLEGVVITETRLSRIDGEAGELLIRGFPLDELAPRARFEETLFLLWNDRLPDGDQEEEMRRELAAARSLPSLTLEVLRESAAAGLAPMDALRIGLATLGVVDPELHRVELQRESRAANQERALRLVAALPSLAAAYFRLGQGDEPVAPDAALRHAENYLYMLSGERPDAARTRALETYLNSTVDHGMNASTFTARVIASTRSGLASAIEGALGALKGPLHGGAPGPALDMLSALREQARTSSRSLDLLAEAWVRDRVARGERIMGFGHRVYRVRDPRADVLGAAIRTLFPSRGDNPLYDDARDVEQAVVRTLQELKPERQLQTNVEFYTALLLQSLGIAPELFTPTFAVARIAGWTAHVLEQIAEDRLIRPRVAYAGPLHRGWIPSEQRPAVAAPH